MHYGTETSGLYSEGVLISSGLYSEGGLNILSGLCSEGGLIFKWSL